MFSKFRNSDLAMIALALEEEENEDALKKRRQRMRKWVDSVWKSRPIEGEFITLFPRLMDDDIKFYGYFRMTRNTFHLLLNKLEENLKKKDTFWRKCIPPRERLAVCLRFLATGDTFKTISYSYRLGRSTVAAIIYSTCKAIVDVIQNEVMPVPDEAKWNIVSSEFWVKWQFPNCIGALDGKHVTIQAPKLSGSLYWNYKHSYSIVLLALVDPCYKFIAVDVGAYGKNSDGGIFVNSNFGRALENRQLNVPTSRALPGTNVELPMVIVADEAFPLKSYMMRPYPGKGLTDDRRIFNYRLSRARRISENVFGILAQKFRIFFRRLQGKPENTTTLILAACVLHNFIRENEGSNMAELNESNEGIEGNCFLEDLPRVRGGSAREAFAVRDTFKDFFNSPAGSAEWQARAALAV
ncbi:uncharacterized protein LOC134529310 [Bacillus rossius redtenbacheri]|uniref:uncharacterized protein LOC134529310 n=1 Tax=Bacillus rossius redtenbacheri TaxID=93214 RepID=UPI002FDCFEE8